MSVCACVRVFAHSVGKVEYLKFHCIVSSVNKSKREREKFKLSAFFLGKCFKMEIAYSFLLIIKTSLIQHLLY